MRSEHDDPNAASHTAQCPVGLYFFSACDEEMPAAAGYEVLIEAAKAADQGGLDFVWVPERHFTPFGGAHPNPAVLAAALAVATRSIRIRAGSVVLPLHDPIRVAEEWAVVDNLSGGRVELSSATGWNPRDFVLAPKQYVQRASLAKEHLRTVQALWSGATVQRVGPSGAVHEIRTYPRPIQPRLPHWVTAAGNPATFRYAGETGAGLLTSYGLFPPAQLASLISEYRRAHAAHHTGPGRVSVMVHTAIGADGRQTRQLAQEPLRRYLEAYANQQETRTDAETFRKSMDFAVQRYLRGRSLIGDRDEVEKMMRDLYASGADEVACLVDFGVPRTTVLETVNHLTEIKYRLMSERTADIGRYPSQGLSDPDPPGTTGHPLPATANSCPPPASSGRSAV
ncbi:MupA/Atu3671 family FMN-dependent luciferase-like monooxygenase [Streptomyces sp. NPDC048428]|uniref:MupA/Atu3671 family FMN-dependent luciferase-like monooxygenase n=1 Tax=Streptomyces sp. NPDC048428 TaxID=3154503 RepID=UPI003421EACA